MACRSINAALTAHRRTRRHCSFGRVRDTSLPERGPDAGTMDQVRPLVKPWHPTTRTLDWSAYPLRHHQVAALRADPGQKHDPGEGHTRQKGLTQTGPLQKLS